MNVIYPYSRPQVTAEDISAVIDVLQTQFLTQGPNVEEFENELAAITGAKFAIVCNSGTAALHLAYLAFGLGPEKGLLTSPITFLATANAARMCGAPVVFADVDPLTGNLTPESVTEALRTSTVPIGAIAAVHLGGRPCDLAALREIASANDCKLIEDAAHAPLASYSDSGGRVYHVGACSHSDVAVLSFHAIKHVAMGEGGAVLTNDAAVAERARILRSHGMVRDSSRWASPPEADASWYYEMQELGWNYRATDLQCALGRSQLNRLRPNLQRRYEIAKHYDHLLADIPHLRRPKQPTLPDGNSRHLYSVDIDFDSLGCTRGEVMRQLMNLGVGTQVHYIPVYRQPYYASANNGRFTGAERYYAGTLSIPMYVGLEERDQKIISQNLRTALTHCSSS